MAYPTRLKNLHNVVEWTLSRFPETRNDDAVLTTRIWEQYCRDFVMMLPDGKFAVTLDNIKYLPREDNVKRIRAKLQNEKHLYLPTDPQVRARRQISEEDWRTYLGKNPEMRTV